MEDYKEKFEKVWNYVQARIEGLNPDNDDYDWGVKSAFEEVLDFMDEL